MRVGMTFGVWDMIHYGHLRLLERAKANVDVLLVGVCSDKLNRDLKGKDTVIGEEHRAIMVGALKPVSRAFIYRGTNYVEWFKKMGCNILIVGEEFGKQGVPEHDNLLGYCNNRGLGVIRLPRTPGISTTQLKEEVANGKGQ